MNKRSKFVVLVLSMILSCAASAAGEKLPAGVSEDWWSKVRAGISAEEYRFSPGGPEEGALFSAVNRAHGFKIHFTERGARIRPSKSGPWSWGLEVVDGTQESGIKPGVSASGNRVEVARKGFTEWYVNDEKGLEQGFTVPRPLSGDGSLFIDMKIKGGLHAKFAEDGQAVHFYEQGNVAVLTYSGLKAYDSAGTVLPSRFEPINGGIRIVVDDSSAVYPVTIDPLATTPSWALFGGFYDQDLGCSAATAGDVNGDGYDDVIVGISHYDTGIGPGAKTDVGAARLYLGGASGLATTPSWGAYGTAEYDYLGTSVSTAGDINGDGLSDFMVGVPGDGNGTVTVLYGSRTCNFVVETIISHLAGEGLGTVVAAGGDVNGDGYSDILVSAPAALGGLGSVYLFTGSITGLGSVPSWEVSGQSGYNTFFGACTGTAGDVNGDGYSDIFIGDAYTTDETGVIYVYNGGISGPGPSPSWTALGAGGNDNFAFSASTAGDVDGDGYSDLVVGAKNHGTDIGRAYIFRGSTTGLLSSPSWTLEGEAAGSYFGHSVATAGDINGDGYADVIVGAPWADSDFGKAYLYLGGSGGPSTTASWTATGPAAMSEFGLALFTAGDVNGDGYSEVVIGAPEYGGGAAYLFLGSASGPASADEWAGSGETTSNYYGWSLASAGDVNGDGYSDIVVGAYNYNGSAGKAYLYLGSVSGPSSSASWTAAGEAAINYFGISVASAGDVNGDGYSDVIIGARNHDSNTGKAYLYPGSSTGLATAASWTAVGESAGAYFGNCVASAGDVNGDGYSDVVVGAYGYSTNTGRAYLYLGGVAGLSSSYSWVRTGETAGDYFGYSVATAGDINGDGYSDVMAGAYRYNSDAGKAYLYLGSASGLSTLVSWSQAGADVSFRFGMCVATAGDVNGDGYSDVVIGANYFNGRMGKAYVFNGGASGLSVAYSWTADGELSGAGFGHVVAPAGDVNGDGYCDIVVGSPQYSSSKGRAYVFLGSASGVQASASWTGTGTGTADRYGYCVAPAGDVNGDGFPDLLIGAPYASTSTGASYLYLGNGGAGKSARLRQSRNDLSAPVAPGGNAYEQSFRAKMLLRSPFGRSLSKLEWQAAPLLGSLNIVVNPPLSSSRWWDTGLSGVTPTETVDVSQMEGPWIWRARARYNLARSPFQARGPWFTLCANGLRESDLRSVAYSAPPDCVLPDESCWIYLVTTDGVNHTINFQDPNQPDQRTGWNVRRSSDASVVPKSSWPVVCSNCVDMDASAANYQWTDSSGDTPPSGVWYYLVTTYNENCPAEGPFSPQ